MAFDLKGALISFAPTLATMLAGPLAGTAVKALEDVLGLTPGAGLDGITKVVSTGMTPESIVAVRQADQHHAEILAQQAIDVQRLNLDFEQAMAKIDADNVTGARRANIEGGTQIYLFALSLVLLTLGLGTEAWVLFAGVPEAVHDIVIGRVLGLLDAVVMMVIGYWFGTSHGSTVKTALLTAAPANKK
jgi:hypothetical protein